MIKASIMKVLKITLPAPFRCFLKVMQKETAVCFDPVRTKFYSAQPKGELLGRVLIAHLVEGVLLAPDDPRLQTHNHFVEARLMAEVFLEIGYAVDFIDYRNEFFVPRYSYDVFICPRINFERLGAKLSPKCIKIVHLETTHWLYNNASALRRLQEVQARRGVALTSYTEIAKNRAIEVADYATMLGNDLNYETYAFAGKKIFQLPNPGNIHRHLREDKDFVACKTRFLWLGSQGLVHKGLDIALEAFARMPDFHLTVCGPIDKDPCFAETFRKELYNTPNIHTHGWIDITSAKFSELANRTVAHVYPTCADAACGSVINCMHAGLIPVVTCAATIDIHPSFGFLLEKPSVEAVMNAARQIASLPAERLAEMARRSQQEAQERYSAVFYKEVFGAVVAQILKNHPGAAAPGFIRMNELLS